MTPSAGPLARAVLLPCCGFRYTIHALVYVRALWVMRKQTLLLGLLAAFGGLALAPVALATPYVITINQAGANVVISGTGALDLTGLYTNYSGAAGPTIMLGSTAGGDIIQLLPGAYTQYWPTLTTGGASNQAFAGYPMGAIFGSQSGTARPAMTSGAGIAVDDDGKLILVPSGYVSGDSLTPFSAVVSGATLAGPMASGTTSDLNANLGLYSATWGFAPDQSVTIAVGDAATTLADNMLAAGTSFTAGAMTETQVEAALTPPASSGSGTGTASGGIGASPVLVPEPAEAGIFGLGLLLIGGAEAMRKRKPFATGSLATNP